MEKDLYDILGIERFEDARGVQEAYRRLAKRYHPDCAGEGGTAKFREIQEAYEVLSDAQRRMSYDVSLARTRQSDDPLWDEQSDPGRASRLHPRGSEPLVPTAPAEPLSGHVRPPPGSFSRGTKKPVEIEIVLPWHKAIGGVTVRLPVPTMSRCATCSAMQTNQMVLPCLCCRGTGTIAGQIEFDVTLPSGVRDGMVVDIPEITMSHIATCPLRVHVRVELLSYW